MSFFRHAARKALLLAALQAGLVQAQSLPVPAADAVHSVPAGQAPNRKAKKAKSPVAAAPADPYQQALASLRLGRVSEAHAFLRERLQQAPQDLLACRLLATLLLDSGQQAEAAQVLAAGLAQAPQATDIARSLAQLQAKQGGYAMALQTLEGSAIHAERDAEYIAFMAVLAAQAEQPAKAIALWQQAVRLEDDRGVWWQALAHAQQQSGDRSGARRSYETALSRPLDVAKQRQVRSALRQLERSAP